MLHYTTRKHGINMG